MIAIRQTKAGIGHLARAGALLGIGLTLTYTLVFLAYSLLRVAVILPPLIQSAPIRGTLGANVVSLLFTCLMFALLLAPVSAFIGAMTAAALKLMTSWLNPQGDSLRTTLVAALSATALALIAHIALAMTVGTKLFSTYLLTYLFWLGLPSIIYTAAAVLASRQLFSKRFQSNDM